MAVFGVIVAPTLLPIGAVDRARRAQRALRRRRTGGRTVRQRIIGRHVLWAVRAPVIIHSSFVMAAAIGIEAGISFLGLGDPAGSSWGGMLQTRIRRHLQQPLGACSGRHSRSA